jgi:hypothetical protein
MTTTQIIVEAYLQSPTGLPKDRFVNIWHFLDVAGADPKVVANTAFRKINDFFTTPGGTGPDFVGTFMERSLDDRFTLIAYDFAAAKPRPEIGKATFDKGSAGSLGMPEEVAVCLSYYTDRNLPSKRGRLYIGPLNIGALDGIANSPARPKELLTSAMQDGGTRLIAVGPPAATVTFVSNDVDGLGTSAATAWALYSPKLGTFAAIEHGWIDDEWDGQSRRRVEASGRLIF